MLKLNDIVTCPSCWHKFPPADVLWISAHPDVLGDEFLGVDAQKRFLPDRFNLAGTAIDEKGSPCQSLACPGCHLELPRSSLELKPFFISIAGTPSCGKSYFLASMTWKCREILPASFATSFTDSDSLWNKLLNDYEEQQFFNPESDQIVKLAKTEEQGDLYSTVIRNDIVYTYPKPFLFDVRPLPTHPNNALSENVSQQVCLYDNAGESFQPGKDTVSNAVTKHLGNANCWIFCFDPTQDPRFRKAAREHSGKSLEIDDSVTARQETVFTEMLKRIRRQKQMSETEKSRIPLVVACTKFDVWRDLLGLDELPDVLLKYRNKNEQANWKVPPSENSPLMALDLKPIQEVSAKLRELLFRFSTDLVTAAENFSDSVTFVPVSATGCAPSKDEATGAVGVRPSEINPIWCEIPLLLALSHHSGLIAYRK